ncbi:MAG: hypothetical protein K2X39_02405 [Silvanigrellaceae bacterium]|nr:hypothetical protein [Silvanigrellaceae bacterium]
MKNRFSSLISTYDEFIDTLMQNEIFFNPPKEFSGFWQRWVLMHKIILKELDLSEVVLTCEQNYYSITIENFMKKRKAAFSALLQGAKINKDLSFTTIKSALYQHDHFFLKLLKNVLLDISFELTKIQHARKASSAYSYQQQIMGS